jgi:ABC-type transport system involved in multi-copper enzyme maturation permease subunit
MTAPAWLVFALLVIREASRRRLLLAITLLTLIIIGFTGWGFLRLDDPTRPLSELERTLITSQALILITFMFAGVLALSSVLVAAPSISGEVESNQALAILARPVARTEYVLGKWLGLGLLIVAYAGGSGALEMLTIRWTTGYVPPHPIAVLALIAAQGLVMLTLALVLSTRLTAMTAGVIALVLYFMAWIGGIVEAIGAAISNGSLSAAGAAMRLILPTDALWRGAAYNLEPASVLALAGSTGRGAGNPFLVTSPIPVAMLLWTVTWVLVMLVVALWSFRHREI